MQSRRGPTHEPPKIYVFRWPLKPSPCYPIEFVEERDGSTTPRVNSFDRLALDCLISARHLDRKLWRLWFTAPTLRSDGHAKRPHLVERLFGLEYQSVDGVFWHSMSVQYLDQLPTFHSIVFKNCSYLLIEIYIRSKLDSLNPILPFSHFRPPSPSGSMRMALFRPASSLSTPFPAPHLYRLEEGGGSYRIPGIL